MPKKRARSQRSLWRKKKFISAPEKRLGQLLRDHFGADQVESQKKLQRWPIDFYIKSLDLYVQLDGEHWHGLDRPINEIRLTAKRSKHDRVILRKIKSDLRLKLFCQSNKISLIRITDRQLKEAEDNDKIEELLRLIEAAAVKSNAIS